MTESGKKTESIIICSAIAVTYIAMYVLTLVLEGKLYSLGIRYDEIIKMNIESLIVALLFAFIPYERINDIWHKDIIGKWLGIKPKNAERKILIEAGIFYILFSGALICIKKSCFIHWDFRLTKIFAFIITLLAAWILINTFSLIKNDIILFIVGHAFIILNGVGIYILSNSFFTAAFITVSLILGWNICNFMSDKKFKILKLIASLLCCAGSFGAAIGITGKFDVLSAWLFPYKEANLPYSWELQVLNHHSLNVPDTFFSWYRQLYHPFMAINTYLGVGALIIMFLAFLILTVAYVRSYKILSANRFKMLSVIYGLFAVIYLYMLLADLGFTPTAGGILVIFQTNIVIIGIVIRLFIRRKVKKSFSSIEEEI